MPRQFLTDVDLKAGLLLAGSAGTAGQVPFSNGPGNAPSWGDAQTAYTITTTAIDKTLANRERCTVTASGKTITLPASPVAGWEVSISIAGTFTDTVIARNGANIMGLAENMTVDLGNRTVTLYYVDATRGWRII